jgi:hypothetical protein
MLEEAVTVSAGMPASLGVTSRVTTPRGRRWASRGVVLGVAGALVASGGAAAAYVTFAQANDRSVVRCFTVPDPGSEETFSGTDVALVGSPTDDAALIDDALGLCRQLWSDGVIRPGSPNAVGPEPGVSSYPVPDLTACVLDSGIAGVFPAGVEICDRFGLPRLQQITD